MSFPYILLALLVFGVLIFIHELGHFIAARISGVSVLEFSIGMGPKLLSKKSKKSGTLYSIRLFPIGGYVSMLGESGMEAVQGSSEPQSTDSPEQSPFVQSTEEELVANGDANVQEAPTVDPELAKHAYCNQSVWKRIFISIAGPFMNVVLGFVLMFALVWSSGVNAVGTTTIGGFYLQYSADSEQNGFLPNDYINYVMDSAPESSAVQINSIEQLYRMIDESTTGSFKVNVLRLDEKGVVIDKTLSDVALTREWVDANFRQSLSAEQLQIGDTVKKVNSTRIHTYHELAYEIMNQGYKPIDFTVERNGETVVLEDVQVPQYVDPASGTLLGDLDFKVYREENFGFGMILKHAWFRSVSTVKMVFDSLAGLFSGRYGAEAVSGPVGITKTISDAAKSGLSNLVYLITVISINLGVMNLLPFPALDGGHLLLYVIEIIRRKPVKKEVEGIINFIGLVILLSLAVVIAIKDIIAL